MFTTSVYIRFHSSHAHIQVNLGQNLLAWGWGLKWPLCVFVVVDLKSNTWFLVLLQPAPLMISGASLVLCNFSVHYNMFSGDFLLCLLGYWLNLAQKVLTVQWPTRTHNNRYIKIYQIDSLCPDLSPHFSGALCSLFEEVLKCTIPATAAPQPCNLFT